MRRDPRSFPALPPTPDSVDAQDERAPGGVEGAGAPGRSGEAPPSDEQPTPPEGFPRVVRHRISWAWLALRRPRGGWGPRRRAVAWALAGLAVAAVAAIAAVALAPPEREPAISALPYDGRSPIMPATGSRERVLVRLPRRSLGAEVAAEGPMSPRAQQRYTRSLEAESESLRSALDARGITLRDVVTFSRVWNGFAATVPARDLPRLQSLGVRELPLRRFYPASSASIPLDEALPAAPRVEPDQAPIVLLDSGVDASRPPLRGRVEPGYDAVDGDRDPRPGRDPRQPDRLDQHGTQLAGVLALTGARVRAIRVAGLQVDERTGVAEEFATTEQLLSGLEAAVDPDADGDAEDAPRVALVGVNAPFDGFQDTPEAEAAQGAAGLGTLVVAPAGNEGRAAGDFGTVGGPGAGPAALAVGAATGEGFPELPRVALQAAGGPELPPATLLGGRAPAGELRSSGPLGAGTSALEDENDVSRVAGRLAIVAPGERPAARVGEVAAAGARAILLAEPDPARPLPAIADAPGGIPVLGLTGPAAARALRTLPRDARVMFGETTVADGAGRPRSAPFSARGPAFAGAVKPDVAAGGTAITATVGGATTLMSGTSVAAARAAAVADRLARARPELGAGELAAMVTGAAMPALDVRAAGAGTLRIPDPRGIFADPRSLALPPVELPGAGEGDGDVPAWRAASELVVRNHSDRPRTLAFNVSATPDARARALPRSVVLPPGGEAPVQVVVEASGSQRERVVSGRLVGTERGAPVLSVPLSLPVGVPPPPPVGRLTLMRRRGAVNGVRFTAGEFRRGNPATTGTLVRPIGRLVLELQGADGRRVRTLTPAGGATALLPAEFGYELPDSALRDLPAGRYRFTVRAEGPRGGGTTVRRSAWFRHR